MNQITQSPEDVRHGSQLVAAAMLRNPAESPVQFPSKAWRDGWQQLQDQHQNEAIPFSAADPLLDGLLLQLRVGSPEIRHFRDVIWKRGQAGLFSASSGLLLEDTYPARFLRKRQCPFLASSKLELTCSVTELPSLERAIYWPSLACGSFHALLTEALPYAWPWFDPQELLDPAGRVVIGTADRADDPWLGLISSQVRRAHGFICLSEHLPSSLRLEDVLMPTPAYSVEAGFSDVYLEWLDAWLAQQRACDDQDFITGNDADGRRLYLVLDVPRQGDDALSGPLEQSFSEAGWICRNLNRDGLVACLRSLEIAEQVVTLDPVAAWLGRASTAHHFHQQWLILGRQPAGLDLFQMIRRRQLCGHWLQLPNELCITSDVQASIGQLMPAIERCFG